MKLPVKLSMKPPSHASMPSPESHGSDDESEALWMRQERLRKAVVAGEPVTDADHALYAALARVSPPPPPEDFAAATAAVVLRSADARHRVARLRGALLRTFGLLYLPVMLLVLLAFVADPSATWGRLDPVQRQSLQWAMAVALLAAGSTLTARTRRRGDAG